MYGSNCGTTAVVGSRSWRSGLEAEGIRGRGPVVDVGGELDDDSVCGRRWSASFRPTAFRILDKMFPDDIAFRFLEKKLLDNRSSRKSLQNVDGNARTLWRRESKGSVTERGRASPMRA